MAVVRVRRQVKSLLKYGVSSVGAVVGAAVRLPVHDTATTLDYLTDHQVSMSRLGDGELELICGQSLGFQRYSYSLADRLTEVLQTKIPDHICCVPRPLVDRSGLTWQAQTFWRWHLIKWGAQWGRLCTRAEYFDASVTRLYMDYRKSTFVGEYFDKFRNLWRGRQVVVVEGEFSRLGEGNDLLAKASSVEKIIAPARNAWSEYDQILMVCLDAERTQPGSLFLIALGPTATVLAYDLAKVGIQALDIGHLDVEYEWFGRGSREKTPIAGKWVNEVGGLAQGQACGVLGG